MKEYNLKHFAHIGDAVWELFIREIIIERFNTQKGLHQNTIKYVNANFQSFALETILPDLTEEEKETVKRGRNLPLTAQKKNNQNIHRLATAFEVLIGSLYLTNKPRLNEIFEIMREKAL